MEPEEFNEEEKCENLMNVVVESRKRFGKMCVDYEQKASFEQNKILNLQLETISTCQFKSKNPIPVINTEDMVMDIDEFAQEIYTKQRRIEGIKKKLRDTHEVVQQIRRDEVIKKAKETLTKVDKLAVVTKSKSQVQEYGTSKCYFKFNTVNLE